MAPSPDFFSSSNLLCTEDASDVASGDEGRDHAVAASEWAPACPGTASALVDDRGLASLLAAETDHMPRPDYLSRFLSRTLDATARHDAVKWILKVNELYRFRPLTAYLSVNYLDRFLSSHSLPGLENGGSGGGWPMQLLSVACVSVAAKMEETHVPSLLDLQFLDQRYVFDPHTVGRMELLLMTALGWRMRAITPFDFLPHLVPSCPSALLSRAADLILSSLRVVDFLGYRPSAIAAAAALCTADEVADPSAGGSADVLRCSDEWVNKEVVSDCRQLMEDYLIDTCPSAPRSRPRTPYASRDPQEPPPRSPVAVLDVAACGSCDSAAQGPSAATFDAHGIPVRPEAPPKRRRLLESRCTDTTCAGSQRKGI
ncbi:Cyclin, C-terminal domain [Musa troglodytarum]|uniref:Cyclin, C-terminal domain n=1 Tax=Musa troglodytarum TaxID=320322 RepID=A0A9E7ECF8_9LILI|nr:Cyclin, C-terminal domain [Musa troglodytarum]